MQDDDKKCRLERPTPAGHPQGKLRKMHEPLAVANLFLKRFGFPKVPGTFPRFWGFFTTALFSCKRILVHNVKTP